ncbi:S-adenosyl-L-methionine-dependent methyltransferase [Clavulina sp. PMI_390]|nr:S-adenosyl-L-methionine-dependent methyltransferase [Clavulina sp. PMI_390]
MNFYFEAARVLDKIEEKKGSIKGILAQVDLSQRKRMSAAVIRTLEYKPALLDIIKASDLLKHEKKIISSRNLALVLVHDLLFSKGIEAGDGPIKQAILRHKTRLHSELVKLKIKKGAKSNKDLARPEQSGAASIPRYVRVNTNVGTLEDARKALTQMRKLKEVEFGQEIDEPASFSMDPHVPDLLALHPSITVQSDNEYRSGLFILQDKASCLPATVLKPPRSKNAVVIDATAAPGNKTSHLSALMGNVGTIFAFERDKRRFKTLEKMLEKARCQNVRPTCCDFLETKPDDSQFREATHILLDPSCSGSGIVNRLDHLGETENDEDESTSDRLQKLGEFQLSMIRHAMKFPKMQKIVYSTCSIHAQENEHVVRAALKSTEADGWVLAPRAQVLPAWPRRGIPEEIDGDAVAAESLIRTQPGEDRTNGFFVAAFVRSSLLGGPQPSKRKHEDEPDGDSSEDGDEDEDEEAREQSKTSKKKKKKKKKKRKTSTPGPHSHT